MILPWSATADPYHHPLLGQWVVASGPVSAGAPADPQVGRLLLVENSPKDTVPYFVEHARASDGARRLAQVCDSGRTAAPGVHPDTRGLWYRKVRPATPEEVAQHQLEAGQAGGL